MSHTLPALLSLLASASVHAPSELRDLAVERANRLERVLVVADTLFDADTLWRAIQARLDGQRGHLVYVCTLGHPDLGGRRFDSVLLSERLAALIEDDGVGWADALRWFLNAVAPRMSPRAHSVVAGSAMDRPHAVCVKDTYPCGPGCPVIYGAAKAEAP